VIFQDFPGPGNLKKTNPGLSRIFQEAWEPCGDIRTNSIFTVTVTREIYITATTNILTC